jgi:MFS transporter, BCD family, chlorophyll transporter
MRQNTMTAAQGARAAGLSWFSIARLGLVQSCLGALVVLPTATLNRVMTVELGLVATLPAALVAWHYVVQLSRPRWGHGADGGKARTPWIWGGVAVLGLGVVAAAAATLAIPVFGAAAILAAVLAYGLIGAGVAAAGTSLLALLASTVAPQRRPAAAALTWIMMIVGIVFTAIVAGANLDPFTGPRLMAVAGVAAGVATAIAGLALWGVERRARALASAPAQVQKRPALAFRQALARTWAEPFARRFTVFVFVSMLAYNMQDMILEPFAGLVFGFSVGQSTQLSGLHQSGVLLGMVLIGAVGARVGGHSAAGLRTWMVAGCLGSAAALIGLAGAGLLYWEALLRPATFAMGLGNGVFAVAAIGAMMALAGAGGPGQEGVRMGVWGAAQAIAFGAGGLAGAGVAEGLRRLAGWQDGAAFGAAFALEGAGFVLAAWLAFGVARDQKSHGRGVNVALPTDFEADQLTNGSRP